MSKANELYFKDLRRALKKRPAYSELSDTLAASVRLIKLMQTNSISKAAIEARLAVIEKTLESTK